MKAGKSRVPLEAIPLAEQGTKSEKVWLHYGDVNSFNKMHFLNQCLVGNWGMSQRRARCYHLWRVGLDTIGG